MLTDQLYHNSKSYLFPRDKIESYTLCYSIFGFGENTISGIQSRFIAAYAGMTGTVKVIVRYFSRKS